MVTTSDGQRTTGFGPSFQFTLNANGPGFVEVFVTEIHGLTVPPAPQPPAVYDTGSAIVDVLPAGSILSPYTQAAWNLLHSNGVVNGEAIARNRQITALYTILYNSGFNAANPAQLNPFEWFGAASFASKTVGDGLAAAIVAAFKIPNSSTLPVDPKALYDAFGEGNLEIYLDMYAQGLAYQTQGMAGIQTMFQQNVIPRSEFLAWQKIDQGIKTTNANSLTAGMLDQVFHEQTLTLQHVVNTNFSLWAKVSIVAQQLNVPLSSGYPGGGGDFNAWCAANPAIVGLNYSFANGFDRYQWFAGQLLPLWQNWRLTHTTINFVTLETGGYQ